MDEPFTSPCAATSAAVASDATGDVGTRESARSASWVPQQPSPTPSTTAPVGASVRCRSDSTNCS